MSFSSLRPNSVIYILNKDNSTLPEINHGTVTSVSAPMPKYGNQNQFPMHPFGQQQEMTVDLIVKVGDKTGPFNKVTANADVFDVTPSMMISTDKEAINAELSAMRKRDMDELGMRDFRQQRIAHIDKMLADLNPEVAEKQAQAQEIASLKEQVAALTGNVKDLVAALTAQGGQSGQSEKNGKSKNS